MLVGALCISIISVATRKLKEINFAVIQLYYGVVSTFFGFCILLVVCLIQQKVPFKGVTFVTWWQILLCGLINVVAQNLLTVCNQKANPASVGILSYVSIVYSFMADYLLFQTRLRTG